jgi:hypothetical protein
VCIDSAVSLDTGSEVVRDRGAEHAATRIPVNNAAFNIWQSVVANHVPHDLASTAVLGDRHRAP